MGAMTAVLAGFYGKLPARGDFVRAVLPRDFTDRWDAWLAPAIAGSREALGESWLPAFLEAPVWRFALSAGLCGERAALGLMLPSVDRAGRYFPLTFAALFTGGTAPADDPAWLDGCEAAGRAALEQDAGPERLGAMLGVPWVDAPCAADDAAPRTDSGSARSTWWTDGAPRVPATRFVLTGLPDAFVYATMLGATVPGAPTGGKSWEPPS
ncbi:MAG TPA: type VI secretion system-associated protein TagF [Acetobacteraceae bacterium]|nr:type VI secretion system-associated protein TagF [Acetobacteraceae bacterium]